MFHVSAISARMIDRIFSGAVTRGVAQKEGKMSYTEFVWFLLAEEDKRASTSIEYWWVIDKYVAYHTVVHKKD